MPDRSAPAALAALLLLAGCYEVTDIPPGPPPEPLSEPPVSFLYEWTVAPAEAIPAAEEIAARCWLDGPVGAAAMIVDRESGRIVMTGEDRDLLVVDFLPTLDLAQMRLSGPVVTEAARMAAILEPVTELERTGEFDCPEPEPEGDPEGA